MEIHSQQEQDRVIATYINILKPMRDRLQSMHLSWGEQWKAMQANPNRTYDDLRTLQVIHREKIWPLENDIENEVNLLTGYLATQGILDKLSLVAAATKPETAI